MSKGHAIRAAVSMVAILFATETALAQIQPETASSEPDDQAIVVTGSRIPRSNLDTAQPLLVLNGAQIELRGQTNIADALDDLPAFGVPGASRMGAASQQGPISSGQNFVNLFGLGDQRTLTVVNGRRFVSSNTASIFGPTGTGSQVDFNVLPTLMIDRVETIAVGGAPIYGSDAIAGTVNVITKRDFQGVKLDAQYGLSSRADARDYRIRGAVGTDFAEGRGNIALFAEYNQAAGLTNFDRPDHGLNRSFNTPSDPTSPFSLGYIADTRLPGVSQYGIPSVTDAPVFSPTNAARFGAMLRLPFPFQAGITDNLANPLRGNPLVFNKAGELVPIDFGKETGDLITSDGGNGFVTPGSLLAPSRRYLASALAQYEVSDGIRLFGEGWYANSKGTQLTGQPEYNSVLFADAGQPGGNLVISLDNPYLSSQARSIIAANLARNPLADSRNSFLLGRANTDLTSGTASSTVEIYRFVGGADGDFEALGRQMGFEASVNYGKSTTQGNGRAIVQQNLLNAINAVSVNGVIQCAPGANSPMPTISATCAPINPFGQNISQAARDYVTAITDPRSESDQLVFNASVTGSLFDLGAGAAGFAAGYEHRRETADFDPGRFYLGAADPNPLVDSDGDGIPDNDRVSYGSGLTMNPVSGGFDTDELFAELTVPLVSPDQDMPFVRSLSVNGALRYIDHSLAGGDPTYTAGATWQPIEDITFRGNFTRSVRAPSITEFYNPRSGIRKTAADPCDVRFLNAGPDPAVRRANCAADGLPANFVSGIVSASRQGSFSGNRQLENEKADAWTVGAIVRPRFVPHMTLTVDWVNIKVKDAVEALTVTNILNACYDSAGAPSKVDYCSLFTRNAQGQITSFQEGYQNAAQRTFEGLVAALDWTVPTPFLGAESAMQLGVNYLYNHKVELKVGVDDLTVLDDGIGYPRHQATTSLTYRNKGFAWQWQAQYTGKTQNDPNAPASDYEYPTVGDVMFINSSIAYDINERFSMNFVVDNLFDTRQPFPVPARGGTVAYFDGILGRYFKVGAGVKF